jgi:hypothetical protein
MNSCMLKNVVLLEVQDNPGSAQLRLGLRIDQAVWRGLLPTTHMSKYLWKPTYCISWNPPFVFGIYLSQIQYFWNLHIRMLTWTTCLISTWRSNACWAHAAKGAPIVARWRDQPGRASTNKGANATKSSCCWRLKVLFSERLPVLSFFWVFTRYFWGPKFWLVQSNLFNMTPLGN